MLPCVTMEGLGKHLLLINIILFFYLSLQQVLLLRQYITKKVAMPILAFHLVLYNVIAIPANILLFTHSPWSIHQEQSLHVSLVLYCVLVTYLILDSNIIVFTIQFVLYLICLVEIN